MSDAKAKLLEGVLGLYFDNKNRADALKDKAHVLTDILAIGLDAELEECCFKLLKFLTTRESLLRQAQERVIEQHNSEARDEVQA